MFVDRKLYRISHNKYVKSYYMIASENRYYNCFISSYL